MPGYGLNRTLLASSRLVYQTNEIHTMIIIKVNTVDRGLEVFLRWSKSSVVNLNLNCLITFHTKSIYSHMEHKNWIFKSLQ